MKYTQIPSDTFSSMQLNAGVLLSSFDPATGIVPSNAIIGATTGGVNFTDSIEYLDFGDDIDNCPKNMKELKVLDSHEVKMSGTFVAVSPDTAKLLAGAADKNGSKIVPRNDLLGTDFSDIWWVGDYSDVNTGDDAGFIAIKMINALNTGGFQIQSADKAKGQFAFEFTGHYSMSDPDVVPYEIYIKGAGDIVPSIVLNTHTETLRVGDTYQLRATVFPSGTSVTYTSSATAKASVNASGLVTAVATGTTIVTAAITVDGVTYNDTCTIIVEAAS